MKKTLKIASLSVIALPLATAISCGTSAKVAPAPTAGVQTTHEMRDVTGDLATYYTQSTLNGKKGNELFDALHTIQAAHTNLISQHGYGGLYDTYDKAFKDTVYENDGSILDIYSEKPNAADPYNFLSQAQKDAGHHSHEGDTYNREHIVPQSTFSKKPPMHDDPHHVFPTDSVVNGRRSNYPHGIVVNATWTSENGSKLGTDKDGNTVFEPIDAFKGDVARAYMYFQLTYHGKADHFAPLATAFPYFNQSYLSTYLKWSKEDPVDKFDIQRNEAIGRIYHLRNPFTDYPNLDSIIFDATSALDASKVVSIAGINFNVQPTTAPAPAPTSGGTQHHTSGTQHHTSGTTHTNTGPTRVDASTLPQPDTTTWGAKWIAHYDIKANAFVKAFGGATYDDVLDQIADKCKNHYAKGSSFLRESHGKWRVWDVPAPIFESHGHKFVKVQDKLTSLGFPTNTYPYDSVDDAIAALKALPEDEKAKIFNTLD